MDPNPMDEGGSSNPGLALGVPEMDRGHRLQADLVEQLIDAIAAEAGSETVQTLLLRLVDETTDHFATEQELMRGSAYPAHEEHAETHNRLLDHVARLLADFASGNAEMTLHTARSLRRWLLDHVQGMDRELAAYLRRLREGGASSPAEPG